MARYEGMDELLERVREVAEKSPPCAPQSRAERHAPLKILQNNALYDDTVNQVRTLLEHARTVDEALTLRPATALTDAQCDDLIALLGSALQTIETCRGRLTQLIPRDPSP